VTDHSSPERPGEKDRVRPFHARDVTTGQEAAELVAATLKHAAEREQAAKAKRPPKQQPKWMLPVGLNLGVLAAYLLIAPPAWVVMNPIAPPPEPQQVEGLRTAMYFATTRIDNFRIQNGRLPSSLAEAGVSYQGIDYTPQGDSTYVLVSSVGEETVVFNSAVQTANEWVGNLSRRIGG
jgi:hypothetical protein